MHGDYRIDNLIVAKSEPKVLAVLGLGISTLGDPLADFTYHLMAWHMPPTETGAGTATLAGHDLKNLGIPPVTDYVDAYVARTGLDPRPHLPVYLAYNFFRTRRHSCRASSAGRATARRHPTSRRRKPT